MTMDLRKIARAGDARAAAIARADDRLNAIADEVITAGDKGNIKLAAKLANVDRSVLSRRVRDRR